MKEDYHQVNQWLKTTLEAAPSEGMKVIINWIIAFLDYLYGKSDQAFRLLDQSAATATEYKNDLYYMGSIFLKAFICYDLEEYEKAQAYYRTSLSIALTEPTSDTDEDLLGYYFFEGLLHLKLNHPDSTRYYAERIKSGSGYLDQDFPYNYLIREIQIAAAVSQVNWTASFLK